MKNNNWKLAVDLPVQQCACSLKAGQRVRLRKDHTVRDRRGKITCKQYSYDLGSQRTQQVLAAGNYINYTYDNIGQLKTARGWESDGATLRLQEQFGYGYDAAWNLQSRTNNALVQTYSVNAGNELSTAASSGTLTVAGSVGQFSTAPSVTVSGTGLSSGAATVYGDGTWARAGASFVSGQNSYSATATDSLGRTSTDSVTATLTTSATLQYDANGNLTNDGLRSFEYDFENQLTNVYVASQWRSEFVYDGALRRRIRREYTWSNSAWVKTNEVRYVYDGRLVVQERDANNVPQVAYTRGTDLSGTRQGAGGIGGILARTDESMLNTQPLAAHAYYSCDGNGNVTCLVNTNNLAVAYYKYDPFGNISAMSGTLANANVYRFSTKEYHVNSRLSYYLSRFYDAGLQRWINRDPLQESRGLNLYGLLENSAINAFDPFGFDSEKPCGFWHGLCQYLSDACARTKDAAKCAAQACKDKLGIGSQVGTAAAGAGMRVVSSAADAGKAAPGAVEAGILAVDRDQATRSTDPDDTISIEALEKYLKRCEKAQDVNKKIGH